MTPAELEAKRILAEYERRRREVGGDFDNDQGPGNLFMRQGQERTLLRALQRERLLPLADKAILEVGCGLGKWLRVLEEFGAERNLLHGIDLDATRIDQLRARFPGARLEVGDATQLPWPDRSFAIVLQSLVFTSILDPSVRTAVANEMRRVVRKDGVLLWYDFHYDNPANPNVRRVDRKELHRLFPDARIEIEHVTLAPPLARMIAPRSWLLASVLERLRVLNTHYFATIRLGSASDG